MPSAHSPSRTANDERSRSRPGRRDEWPTAGTLLFTGADLEDAVAAAVAELGDDVEVKAARSVKQGLRGKTHVEVLVTRPAAMPRPPLPPSERPEPSHRTPAARRDEGDPVESTLAALLASAEAEEEEYSRAATVERSAEPSVVPFDPPQLAGNPTFAAEFAAAFPAALAAAKAADDEPRPERSGRRPATNEDFTARVRDALRRVPQEDEASTADDLQWDSAPNDAADTDEFEIVRPGSFPHVSRPAVVPAAQLTPARRPAHPAPELMDEPSQPMPARSHPVAVEPAAGRPVPRRRGAPLAPLPGPLAMAGRPASLRRPAGSGWSTARLRDLGVPEAVLAALPAEEPADDLRWLVALTDAITATVPAPVEDGLADVTASGTGLRGALALLRLGVDGVPPQTLSIEGRAVPATATELALAVRAGILR